MGEIKYPCYSWSGPSSELDDDRLTPGEVRGSVSRTGTAPNTVTLTSISQVKLWMWERVTTLAQYLPERGLRASYDRCIAEVESGRTEVELQREYRGHTWYLSVSSLWRNDCDTPDNSASTRRNR